MKRRLINTIFVFCIILDALTLGVQGKSCVISNLFVSVPDHWENVYVWAMDDSENAVFGEAPGKVMIFDGIRYYADIPHNAVSLIISNGDTEETAAIGIIPGRDVYVTVHDDLTYALTYKDPLAVEPPQSEETAKYTVSVYDIFSMSELYIFAPQEGFDLYFGTFPGMPMTKINNRFVAMIPAGLHELNIWSPNAPLFPPLEIEPNRDVIIRFSISGEPKVSYPVATDPTPPGDNSGNSNSGTVVPPPSSGNNGTAGPNSGGNSTNSNQGNTNTGNNQGSNSNSNVIGPVHRPSAPPTSSYIPMVSGKLTPIKGHKNPSHSATTPSYGTASGVLTQVQGSDTSNDTNNENDNAGTSDPVVSPERPGTDPLPPVPDENPNQSGSSSEQPPEQDPVVTPNPDNGNAGDTEPDGEDLPSRLPPIKDPEPSVEDPTEDNREPDNDPEEETTAPVSGTDTNDPASKDDDALSKPPSDDGEAKEDPYQYQVSALTNLPIRSVEMFFFCCLAVCLYYVLAIYYRNKQAAAQTTAGTQVTAAPALTKKATEKLVKESAPEPPPALDDAIFKAIAELQQKDGK